MIEELNDNLQQAEGVTNTENISETIENEIIINQESLENNSPMVEKDIIEAINSENAASLENQEIEMKDYSNMDMSSLISSLSELVVVENVISVKKHVDAIKNEFLHQYNHFIEEKKSEFEKENQDNEEEFHYHFPLKEKFDQLYSKYKYHLNDYFKKQQNSLKTNLEHRENLVEQLKNLISSNEDMKSVFKIFGEIREQWRTAGPIPKDKYNHVWNNYHFHLERFYDILDLDREARDMDFKNNLEQKNKIIARAEELIDEPNVVLAFRELQGLHRVWKEEIGPVSREYREEIWEKFSDITKKIHDRREEFQNQFKEQENNNLIIKRQIIAKIEEIATVKVANHTQWQKMIKEIEILRSEFLKTGRVPSEYTEETWAGLKNGLKNFNISKNNFYKDIKAEQQNNLIKKTALLEKAIALKDSEDYAATTPIMKQIQEEWKTIGHVPKKQSDLIWNEFKQACNKYFDKLKTVRNQENSVEIEALESKKSLLDQVRGYEMTGDHKTDLDNIKVFIASWKAIGKVPFAKRSIDAKFNKILDGLFEQLSLSKKDSETARYSNKLDNLSTSNDPRKIQNEVYFINKKIEETQTEIFQLENNIQFFSNAKKGNSLLEEVTKNITRKKEELKIWKDKQEQLRKIISDQE
ncbi:MAG: DUF349 domain-containing protein [Flavobacterium sp.]|jgi:hypothetical protein